MKSDSNSQVMVSWTQLVMLLFLVIFLLRPVGFAGDPGAGWHLLSGEILLTEGLKGLSPEPFLAGVREPWVHNQWLADIVFSAILRFGGWPLLETVVAVFFVLLLAGTVRPRISNALPGDGAQSLVLFAVGVLLSIQWFLRPVIFSFLFFGLLLLVLDRVRNRGLEIWSFLLVPSMFLLWANMHPGFVTGFALLGLSAAAEKRLVQQLIAFIALGLLSFAATFVTPWGVELYRAMLALGGEPYFMNLNAEWLSPDFRLTFFLPLLLSVGALIILAPFSRRAGWTRFDWFSTGLFLLLALSTRRYVPFFALVIAMPLARTVPVLLELAQKRIPFVTRVVAATRWGTRGLLPVVCLVLCLLAPTGSTVSGAKRGRDLIEAAVPKGFTEALAALNLPAGSPVYSSPNWGGALVWLKQRAVKPAIDDRNELNSVESYEMYLRAIKGDPDAIKVIMEQFPVALLPAEPALVYTVEQLSGSFAIVYRDKEILAIRRK